MRKSRVTINLNPNLDDRVPIGTIVSIRMLIANFQTLRHASTPEFREVFFLQLTLITKMEMNNTILSIHFYCFSRKGQEPRLDNQMLKHIKIIGN